MNPTTTNLPDNLMNRIHRLHIDRREFKDDSGKTITYEKFVVEVSIKDEPVSIEFKIDKKDKMLLALADQINDKPF